MVCECFSRYPRPEVSVVSGSGGARCAGCGVRGGQVSERISLRTEGGIAVRGEVGGGRDRGAISQMVCVPQGQEGALNGPIR